MDNSCCHNEPDPHTCEGQRTPARTRLFAALAVLGSLGLCLAAAEAATRLLARRSWRQPLAEGGELARRHSIWRKSDDPELIYELRPNFVKNGVRHTEDHGIMRGATVSPARAPGRRRIVVLGDSIGAGLAVRSEEGGVPFPELTERLLNERAEAGGAGYEVLNFATDGYNTVQEARLLELKAQQYEPDLILVQFCANDGLYTFTPTIWFLDPPEPRSYLLAFVRSGLCDIMEVRTATPIRYVPELSNTPKSIRRYWNWQYEPGSIGWQTIAEGLDRIAAVGRRLEVPVVLAVFPLFSEDAAVKQLGERIEQRVGKAAAERGLRVLQLRPAYAAYAVEEIAEDQVHPNFAGHQVAARAICRELLDQSLLPAANGGTASAPPQLKETP